jgi:hypothetical protein
LITYPVGVNTVLDGVLPPPGATQFYNYAQYYVSNKFADSHGNSLVPGFRVSYFVDAPRVVHTWSPTFGPFALSSGVVIPIFYLQTRTSGSEGTRTALGDAIVQPLLLDYVNGTHTFFAYLASDVGLPTGSYVVNRVANTGLNTFAWMPSLSVTWFALRKWELSGTALVELNSPNHATNYHSGAVATFDFLVGYQLEKSAQVGLQGYLLKQFTDDTSNGRAVPGGFRAQAVGLGPQLRYNWAPTSGVVFKYTREFAVRNRSQGNVFWFELSFPIGS